MDMESLERLVMEAAGRAVPRRAETRRLTEESKRLDKILCEAGVDVNSNLSIQEKLQLYRVVKSSQAEADNVTLPKSDEVESTEEDASNGSSETKGSAAGPSSASSSSSSASTSRRRATSKPSTSRRAMARTPSRNGTEKKEKTEQQEVVMSSQSKPRPVHRPAPTQKVPAMQPVVQLEDLRVGQVRTTIEHGAGPSRAHRGIPMEVDPDVFPVSHGRPRSRAQPVPCTSSTADTKPRRLPTSNAHLSHRPFDITLHKDTGHVFIRCGVSNQGVLDFEYQGKDAIVVEPVMIPNQDMFTWRMARRYHELDSVMDVRRGAIPEVIKSMGYWEPERLPGPCPYPPTYTERYGDKFPPEGMSAEEGYAVLFHCQTEFRERFGHCRVPHVMKNEPLTLLRGGDPHVFEHKDDEEENEEEEDDQSSVHWAGSSVGGAHGTSGRSSPDDIRVITPQPSTSGWRPKKEEDDDDEVQVLSSEPSTSGYRPKKKRERSEETDYDSPKKKPLRNEPIDPNQMDDDDEEQQEPENDDDSDWEQSREVKKKRGKRTGRRKGPKSPSKTSGKGSPTGPKSPGRPRKEAAAKKGNGGKQEQRDKPSTSNQQSPRTKRLFNKYEMAGPKKDLRSVAGRIAEMMPCPLCGEKFPVTQIEGHASSCGEERK